MRKVLIGLLFLILLVSSGCAGTSGLPIEGAQPTPPPVESGSGEKSRELQHIDLGVGFVPNVQFTPIYVASAKGFFADEGLEVVLEHGSENDFVALTGQGKRQFAVASGDRVIVARSQGLPVVYVMKWYERFPVGVMALEETGIETPTQLEGHVVGFPGFYGASYTGWKALASATGLDEEKIDLQAIGYTASEAINQGQVDAAVIYVTNEPIQLRHAGKDVTVFEVSDYANIVSNGIITNENVMREQPELVRRLVRAVLRGIDYTIENPDESFEISRQAVPEITDENAPIQRDVLEASIALWRSNTPGVSDPQAWQETMQVLLDAEMIEAGVDLDAVYSNQFVE